ncbi:hypothetical protein XaplCFBP3122_19010 [Xanthomonas arboricola pv. populi]|uniref:Uncharacterized protein n=1 Tax=Xanthomonas arboricola pv. populi TaxID=487823 RepID=A0A2S6YZW7_9XANT|nr:hypothetical protein XaplCFBP3122_19010 [Xanthomonas arboricola pv. populi]
MLMREPPPDVPTATITNRLHKGGGRNESIIVYIAGGEDCKVMPRGGYPSYQVLYAISDSEPPHPETMRVSALQPLRFYYFEGASGGRKCEIVADTVLLPGRAYEMRGGLTFEKGLIPIIPSRGCRVEIVELATGAQVRLFPRQSTPMCEGPLGDMAKLLQNLSGVQLPALKADAQ